MEPSTPNKLAKPLTIVGALVVIAGIIGFTSIGKGTNTDQAATSTTGAVDENPTTSASHETTNPNAVNKYKDGTYSAEGNYVSPGGPEKVGVSITLQNDVVVASNFTVEATRPESVQMQTRFAGGYKAFVIGKNIDEVSVTKVSGSSLTPKGFNDALAKIKVEARS